MHIPELFTKKFMKEYFSRNKTLILISATIFLFSIVIGAIFDEIFKNLATEIIKQMLEEIPGGSISENAISLFINNVIANLVILFGGLFFSLLSLFVIIINGILIGYVYTLTTPLVFFVGTIPHGIFELLAITLSFAGALIITKIELIVIQALFAKRLHEEKERIIVCIKDVTFTLFITVILLIIAAIIEAAITPVLLNMVI